MNNLRLLADLDLQLCGYQPLGVDCSLV